MISCSISDSSSSSSYNSSNHPKVAVKILLGSTLPSRSDANYHIINARLLNHRSSKSKSSNSVILPQTHLVSIVENYRTSASKLIAPLSVVTTKETDDLFRSLQSKIPSRSTIHPDSLENASISSNLVHHTSDRTEQISKRSLPRILRSEQQQQQRTIQSLFQPVQYQTSAHTSITDVSTNKGPVHLKYSKGENTYCNYLIP